MTLSVGAHLRNEAELKLMDTTLYTAMRGKFVTAMWYHDIMQVQALERSLNTVCRLPDSIMGGRVLGLAELVGLYQRYLNKWYAAGGRLFVVDNEPNLSWASAKPPQGQTIAGQWAWLIRRVLRGLAIPADATLLLTPMSEPTNHKEWVEEMYVREAGFPSVADYCGAAACHCYWQAQDDMDADWAGRSYQYIHARTGFDVYITEAGCSTQHDTENRQAHDYPIYADKVADDDYVRSLTFYILGSNGDWKLFELSAKVCGAIATRKASS